MKRRIIAGIMLLVMVISLLPAQALAVEDTNTAQLQASNVIASGDCGENVTWVLDSEGLLTISGTGPMDSYWSYGSPWSYYADKINKVVIEEGVTTVGSYIFTWCSSITEVTLPSTVTTIEEEAFRDCGSMRTINLPEVLTFIGANAFMFCNALEKIEFPETLETIGDGAFGMCESLKEIRIPASVTLIGNSPFRGCTGLSGIWVDENNPNYCSDSRGALLDKSGETLIQIPGGLKGAYTVPSGVKRIADLAGYECQMLTALYLPDSLEQLGLNAFRCCTGLKTVTIPASVHTLDSGVFWDCTGIRTFVFEGDAPQLSYNTFDGTVAKGYYPDGNATWDADFFDIYGSDLTWCVNEGLMITRQPADLYGVNGASAGISVEAYGSALSYAWWVAAPGADTFVKSDVSGNRYPVTVNSATDGQRVYCIVSDGNGRSVQTDTVSICLISEYSEGVQTNLTIDTAGENVQFAFIPGSSCNYLISSVGDVDVFAELYDENGTILDANDNADYWNFAVSSILEAGKTYILSVSIDDTTATGSFGVMVSVDHIHTSQIITEATCYTDGLRMNTCTYCSLSWEEIIPAAHSYQDFYCVNCGAEQTYSGTYENLNWSLGLASGCLTISGTGAMPDNEPDSAPWYTYCDSVKHLVIGEGITSARSEMFSNYTSLQTVTLPSTMTEIPSGMFRLDYSLETVYLSEGIQTVGSMAFQYCHGLKQVVLPDGLTTIGDEAFRYCESLERIVFPASISYIDMYAFSDCGLDTVVFTGDAPQIISGAFQCSSAAIYYPGNNTTWTQDIFDNYGESLNWIAYSGAMILSQPQDAKGVPGQKLSASVEACGTGLSYKWWVAAPGYDDFNQTDITASTYSITLNSYTIGLRAYCVITDESGNSTRTDTITFGLVDAVSQEDIHEVTIDTAGEMVYFSFVPQYSCTYLFQSDSEYAVCGFVYDEYMNLWAEDESYVSPNFSMECELFEGGNYILALQFVDAERTGCFDFSVSHSCDNFSSKVTVNASCTTQGKMTNSCNICGYSWTESIPATHQYVNRICTLCGDQQTLTGVCGEDLTWSLSYDGTLTISGNGAMYDYDPLNPAPWMAYQSEIHTAIIEDGVTSVGIDAFNGASALETVSMGYNVASIGESAFWNCSALKSLTLSDCLKTIARGAFGNCVSLTKVNMPTRVKTIGESAFENCTALKTINIPSSITSIGDYAFYNCDGLTDFYAGYRVESIGNGAFAFCDNLMHMQLGDSVESIGEYAFRGCENLLAINIPGSVTTIGERAFDGCDNLMDIYITDLVAWMNISYGSQFSRPHSANSLSKNLYLDGELITELVIPDGVTEISDYAFCYCGNITSVTLPDSAKRIGDYAFANCVALTGLEILDSVSYLGYSAFENCTRLVSVVIPDGVENIYNATFSNCINLTTVSIPDSVTYIGVDAFGHCTSLAALEIPDSVATLDGFAFWGCSALKDIIIPGSVSTIGEYVFFGCTSLESVTFLGDAPAIHENAFCEMEFTIYHPADWSEDVLQNYGGTIDWVTEGDAVIVPTLQLVAPTLNLEDEIYYNIYYTASDLTDVVEMGLITFTEYLTNGTIDDALEVIPGYTQVGSEYMSHTNGIPAKNLGDALYFKAYAKLSDGTYAYSTVAGYHAVAYAQDRLANSTSQKTHQMVVAMLNYGAAAQIQFNYKTDSLMNVFLTDAQKTLVSDYSADMVDSIVRVDSTKVGEFAAVSGSFSYLYPNVAFEGAFSINYYFAPAKAMDGDLTLYYWDLEDYNAANVLTKDNATGSVVMGPGVVAGEYLATVQGIAAKEIDQTVFVAGVYESNGTTCCTGVIAYSLATYCQDRIANGTETMQAFAKATVVYGYYAKQYFA